MNIEERKKQVIAYYNDQFQPKPKKFWQTQEPIYTPVERYYEYGESPQEVEIRLDKKGAVVTTALFLSAILIPGIMNGINPFSAEYLSSFWLFTLFMPLILRPVFDRKLQVKFDGEGLWSKRLYRCIPWNSILRAYIKEETDGESRTYKLVIIWYNEVEDEFKISEMDVAGLEMKPAEIAAGIQAWLCSRPAAELISMPG